MKKLICFIICLIFIACFAFTGCGSSYEITVNGIIYHKVTKYSANNRTEGTECYYVAGCKSDIEILIIPESVKDLPVLGIEDSAFKDNTILKEVTIPNTITSISLNSPSFEGCTSIEKMTLATDDVENLFSKYGSGNNNNTNPLPESLKYIYLTSACTYIGVRSFRYCKYLQELHIPSSVTKIEDGTTDTTIGVNGNTVSSSKFQSLPFLNCNNLTIYCENSTKPDDWGDYWNYISETAEATVVWGKY